MGSVINEISVVKDTTSANLLLLIPCCSAIAAGTTAAGNTLAKTITSLTFTSKNENLSTAKNVNIGIANMENIFTKFMYLCFKISIITILNCL